MNEPNSPEPPRGSRLIIPGAEPEVAAEAPRIVLPPGVSREEGPELPEFPRLRPLIIVPVRDGDRELLLIQDPLGVIPGQPVLGIEALAILQLLDGSVSLTDLSAALMRESKDLRVQQMVRDFIRQLDELLMLESPRFEAAFQRLRDAYHPLEIRPAALEGRAYPADSAELGRKLDEDFAAAVKLRDQVGESAAAGSTVPRGLLAPHLDPRRAGPTIARALLELGDQPTAPLRVVIFGTGHELIGDLYALTRKHFQTPLGRAMCDTAFVDAVAARLGDRAYRSELAHRHEHSIEFAVLYLQRRLRGRQFTIVPILCGGFHSLLEEGRLPRQSEEFENLISAVSETASAQGGTTIYLAGVDLSHVGPRFGDPGTDERVRGEIETTDREALEAARKGDADGWFEAIARHSDSTRICGFAPTYAMLRCASPGEGRLLRYQQSIEDDDSLVSVAAMVWP
ncbi:MAG: AmmeMemoRadiSam system protein B [Candidatus Eiseniibacteriota bacterium]